MGYRFTLNVFSHRNSVSSNGYALYTVIITSTICAILFFISLYGIRSADHLVVSHTQKKQALFLAQSGIARTEYFLNGGDGHSPSWETDSLAEQVQDFGNIKLRCKRFGFFSLMQSIGTRNRESDTISGIAGRNIPPLIAGSLVLTNKSGGCLLKDNSSIDGNIILDHGYITNVPHGRRCLPEYEKKLYTKESPPVPFDSSEIKKQISELLASYTTDLQSTNRISGSKTFTQSNDSLLLQKKIIIDGNCVIDCRIVDKTIISSGIMTLSSKADCMNLLIESDKIICEQGSNSVHSLFFSKNTFHCDGGYHNSQFIATDTLTINKQVKTGNASCMLAFRTMRKDSSLSGGIRIQTGAAIKGSLISCIDPDPVKSSIRPFGASIIIEPGTAIQGYIITDNDVNIMQTTVEGNIWARSIVAWYDSISYTNALIGLTVKKLHGDVLFPMLGDIPLKVLVDKN